MDFELGEEQQAIKSLAAQVLSDLSSHERLKALAAEADFVDRKAWAALASTGVVGASVPEAHGGLGLDFLATAVALEEVGRSASVVPLLTTAVMGAMPIAAFGTPAQRQLWLPGIADGSVLACAALAEDGTTPTDPTTTARVDVDSRPHGGLAGAGAVGSSTTAHADAGVDVRKGIADAGGVGSSTTVRNDTDSRACRSLSDEGEVELPTTVRVDVDSRSRGGLAGAGEVGSSTTAYSDTGGGFVLDGTKVLVAGGLDADVALVPARLDTGEVGVFVVPTSATGLRIRPVEITTGRSEARFELSGVRVGGDALLGAGAVDGEDIVQFIEDRANVGLCMKMAGAAGAAIELAADYTKQRQQFDRPIATFQAVSQRAGDSYIDAEAIWLTAYQAAWRLSAGLPAEREIAIAKYWASEGGYRVVHAAVHVHGGVGVDRDYPLHRHFLAARHIELTLGHAEEQLANLGHQIASS